MRGRDGKIIAAGEFMPVVEQLGFIRLIDRYVLDMAVEELAAIPRSSSAINISGLTATDQPWLRALDSRCARRARSGARG